MIGQLKKMAVNILESHPIGYAVGVNIISRLDFLLPHEEDYWGFKKLAKQTSNKLFLDLGANRGHSARGFNKIVPGWQILSIEANSLHKHQLKIIKNKISTFDYKIAAIDVVSGNKISFYVPYYGKIALHSSAATSLVEAKKGIMSSFPKHEKYLNYVETQTETVSIDDLHIAPGIIKLDVQGKEIDALEGGRNTLTQYSPYLLVEVLFNPPEIINYLSQYGYHPFAYSKATDRFTKFEGVRLMTGTRNLYFSRSNLENL